MKNMSLCVAAACLLLFIPSARGQSPQFPYDRIEVDLNGMSCQDAPRKIYVVAENRRGERIEYPLMQIAGHRWAGNIGAFLPYKPATVRWSESDAGAKLTKCLPGLGTLRTSVLTFTFSQCYKAEEVYFITDPEAIDTRYVRQQGPCREPVDFKQSETVYAVAFKLENIRLLFGPDAKTTSRRGLLVNAVIKKNREKEFVLTRHWVAQAQAAQRNQQDGAKSNLSPDAIDLDLVSLNAIQFSSVTIGRR